MPVDYQAAYQSLCLVRTDSTYQSQTKYLTHPPTAFHTGTLVDWGVLDTSTQRTVYTEPIDLTIGLRDCGKVIPLEIRRVLVGHLLWDMAYSDVTLPSCGRIPSSCQ